MERKDGAATVTIDGEAPQVDRRIDAPNRQKEDPSHGLGLLFVTL